MLGCILPFNTANNCESFQHRNLPPTPLHLLYQILQDGFSLMPQQGEWLILPQEMVDLPTSFFLPEEFLTARFLPTQFIRSSTHTSCNFLPTRFLWCLHNVALIEAAYTPKGTSNKWNLTWTRKHSQSATPAALKQLRKIQIYWGNWTKGWEAENLQLYPMTCG